MISNFGPLCFVFALSAIQVSAQMCDKAPEWFVGFSLRWRPSAVLFFRFSFFQRDSQQHLANGVVGVSERLFVRFGAQLRKNVATCTALVWFVG